MMENQRVRLSKQLLRNSLTELLYKKSIHKISVREICENAQINRTTFYKYYGSQYDLLKDMEDDVLTQISEYLGDDDHLENNVQMISKILTFINENIDLFRILINNNEDPKFPERLINLPRIKYIVNRQLLVDYDEEELEYIYDFVVNGGFSIMKKWINKDDRESPETVAVLLVDTIYSLFAEKDRGA